MGRSDSTMILRNKISSATSRLQQDYLRLKADPAPYIIAEPLPANLLEWHFVLRGPEHSPFEGGFYHGKLMFPRDFPFRPPSIYMLTPNGRFKTNTRLCLSISDFHPDTWNPAWSVSTILTGLLSFMLEKTPTMGSLVSSDLVKRQLAMKSLDENLKHRTFCELFPETVTEMREALRIREEEYKSQVLDQPPTVDDQIVARTTMQNQEQSTLHYIITNVCIVISLVIFGYMIKYVLKNLAVE